jgi:hypothetical protein
VSEQLRDDGPSGEYNYGGSSGPLAEHFWHPGVKGLSDRLCPDDQPPVIEAIAAEDTYGDVMLGFDNLILVGFQETQNTKAWHRGCRSIIDFANEARASLISERISWSNTTYS